MTVPTQHNYRYRLLSLLERGPLGEVYLAEDTYLSRQVALKVIRLESIPQVDPRAVHEALRLFQHEAQILARLHHPHILPLLDYGQVVINGHSFLSFVMPLCSEGSVARWLRQRGKPAGLTLHEVSHILSQAADALYHAHQQQITHLDLKPENLLLHTQDASSLPEVLVADFGLARLVASASAVSQKVDGSPLAMAPEQWEGRPVAATDQYALAVIAYSLLTGRPPYIGSQEHLRYQHLYAPPPPPSHFNPSLPTALNAIILCGLAKRPEERFDSVLTFAHTLAQALSHTAPPAYPTALSPAPVAASAVPAPKPGRAPYRARVVGLGLLLLALLVLVSGIGSSILWSQRHPAPPATPSANETAISLVATARTRKANPNPYPPYTGTLVFSDAMNSDHFNWTTGSTNDTTCAFADGAYQVSGKKNGFANPCLGEGILFSNYHNFVFEVLMTVIGGAGGGIRFHISSVGSYNFVVDQDGHYSLTSYDSSGNSHATLLEASFPASIKAGAKQVDILAVVSFGTQIDLYINHLHVGSTHDSFSAQGSFGLLADQESQVAFNAARLWT